MKYEKAFVVTHIAYRTNSPYDALEGPYSSVCNGLTNAKVIIDTLQIPLEGYNQPALIGRWKKTRKLFLPKILGKIAPLKYIFDTFVVFFETRKYLQKNKNKKVLYIGVDPLSTISLVLLKKFYMFDLVFYSVDFNKHRFQNKFMQFLYEKLDEISSKQSEYVWAVCEGLVEYKKKHQKVITSYVPNSNQYTSLLFTAGYKKRTGNKMCWTGSCITPRQFSILFSVLEKVQKVRPDLEFHFAPVINHKEFEENCKKHGLKKWTVHTLHSRAEWQKLAAICDVGIAIYDDKFGSTKFIEPLKMWDFLLCGLPFIISCEPSIAKAVKTSGAAYLLQPKNIIPKDGSLKKFLDPKNLESLQKKCLELAKEYDIAVQMKKSL
ncbi:hypothetical protein A2799_04850 [Candidatus Roizmanbacteria bacterium RIFCSPHIGHO2_01_FULL_39_24]|uniref:Glycosyl transferase family 1 domain-containing protein n=1 Tax=Candidatus Roizmanbacteria bacterium RIFCSPHIGHO2_01_FULL_39_24 TaxID=1802032 RepID=A0A1F7GLT8_9BACT|nr:MAG: hypothetical protein A2799_04850 [Candidatus Roizmanbacteria bacterium RIFCSPHIGHO2_01_FULL_39_24]